MDSARDQGMRPATGPTQNCSEPAKKSTWRHGLCPLSVRSMHTFWMASWDRTPERMTTVEQMQQGLDLIYDRHGEVQGGRIRGFPQLWKLESTRDFDRIFTMHHFYPKSVTITIRYTDTWMWEHNEELHIEGAWGKWLVLPSSVSGFCIDIESVKRRKDEVD
ncbi:hypothetical protein N7537_007360 [Penicillium hordei]|uniref:Uncharacterized protein n=1 Tax=Penicillium hordei TaxID=40994 RepID=A0AAD6GZA7_9EURO|nr:uncharacterized protein N7537_007360 [Penicillium hordei]KAJ5597276.1 hypothetical protein N7537_007360 [Penicillium hordei]